MTIVFKDGSAITIPGNQLVAQDPKAQDSTKPTAEKSTVKAPAQRVDVKDITHLTDEEKVKVVILQANGSALDGATINVAGDGTATITFPDGSVVTILGKDTVQQSAKGESVTQEATPEYKPETTLGGDKEAILEAQMLMRMKAVVARRVDQLTQVHKTQLNHKLLSN